MFFLISYGLESNLDEEETKYMFSKLKVKDSNGKVIVDSKIPTLFYLPGYIKALITIILYNLLTKV